MSEKPWSSGEWLLRGMNVLEPDTTSQEEVAAFRDEETRRRGYPLPSFDLFMRHGRADVAKRYFAQVPFFYTEGSAPLGGLEFLHLYAICGFTEGVIYEIRYGGHTREANLDALAVAFLHSTSNGMFQVAAATSEYLSTYDGPALEFANKVKIPADWKHDPDLLKCGMDFSNPEMLPGELEKLEQWYERVTGTVPKSVRLLGKYRPNLLKNYRNRWENALKVLPNQCLPFLFLSYETFRGHEEGIRENLLLAKGFGLTRTQALDAICRGSMYGGMEGMSNVWNAAEAIIEDW